MNVLESPPSGKVPLNSVGAPTHEYDIVALEAREREDRGVSASQSV